MSGVLSKIEREKTLVFQMILLYCKKKHKTKGALCNKCKELHLYVKKRAENCPFSEVKTFCSSCQVHCYKENMREEIRTVMRFFGPRMVFYHPVITIRHLLDGKIKKWGYRDEI